MGKPVLRRPHDAPLMPTRPSAARTSTGSAWACWPSAHHGTHGRRSALPRLCGRGWELSPITPSTRTWALLRQNLATSLEAFERCRTYFRRKRLPLKQCHDSVAITGHSDRQQAGNLRRIDAPALDGFMNCRFSPITVGPERWVPGWRPTRRARLLDVSLIRVTERHSSANLVARPEDRPGCSHRSHDLFIRYDGLRFIES